MAKTSKTYRQLRDELDDAVDKLQAADLDVDAAADLYEQAQKAAAALEVYLTEAENRIRRLQTEHGEPGQS